MTNTRIGKTEAPRIAAVVIALLCAHLACSFDSLNHLGNGAKADARSADANTDGYPRERADVMGAADMQLGSGGKGGNPPAGHAGGSGGESVGGAGGATTFLGGTGGVTDSGIWVGTGGGTVTASGGIAEAGGSGGQATGGAGAGGSLEADAGPDALQSLDSEADVDQGTDSEADTSQGTDGETDTSQTTDGETDTPQGTDGETADTAATRKSALFVAGEVPLTGGDAVIRAHLQSRGFDVRVVKDSALATVTSEDANLANLVLISRGVFPFYVGNKFRTTTKPVLVCEPGLYADMGMVDRTLGSWGTIDNTSLVINPWATPLAAGLSGPTSMVTATEEMSYGVPTASATLVATFLDKPTLWPIFAYDSNAAMFGLSAPARRGGFFFSKNAPNVLTHEGWKLFETMVDWLTQ